MKFLDLIQRSTHLLKGTELSVRVAEGRTLRSSLVISKLLLVMTLPGDTEFTQRPRGRPKSEKCLALFEGGR